MATKTREWWRVSGPYITVKTSTTEGMRIIGLHRGAPLPLDVLPETIEHLSSHGLIESFVITQAEEEHLAADPPGGPGTPEPAPPPEPEAVVAQAPTPAAPQGSSSSPRGGGSSARSGSSKAADK